MVRVLPKSEGIEWINRECLSVDPLTKRDNYEPETLSKLSENISTNGFKKEHPLVVRLNPAKKGQYLIIGGQHRFDAALRAGIADFPCIVRRKLSNPIDALKEAHQDNILRCEPDPITEAKYMHKMGMLILEEKGYNKNKLDEKQRIMPIEVIAEKLGEDTSKVKHRLRLLHLHPVIQKMVSRYYMKTTKGLKLSPSIGEELVSIRQRLVEQNVDRVDLELLRIALKCTKEKLRLSDVRKIHTEIALKGFCLWKNKVVPTQESSIRCYLCGAKASSDDNPWLPLCLKHKSLLTTYRDEIYKILYSKEEEMGASKTRKLNPRSPLHEIDPDVHKLRLRLEQNSLNGGEER